MKQSVKLSAADCAQAVLSALEEGVVLIPTDTVYGLAASLTAVERLFAIKGRPAGMPVALLVASVDEAKALVDDWPREASLLAEAFWPGPLTMVLKCDAELAKTLGAQDSLGIRVPALEGLRDLLALTGPLAVTSANPHTVQPLTQISEVEALFAESLEQISLLVDGGDCADLVSSVVAVGPGSLTLLREGAIPAAALQSAIRQD